MLKSKSVMPGLVAMTVAAVAAGFTPALAQNDSGPGGTYRAGVDFGRTLHDGRQCTGSGDYHQGCLDGAQESQFDRQADQAMDSVAGDAKPDQSAPLLSPPPDMFHDPFSKPGDSQPPNN